jgi:anaerobic selenocysteine-containing dehydrogenase
VQLHPRDAENFDLKDSDRAHLITEKGRASVIVRVTPDMAPGAAIVPRLRHTALEAFIPGSHLDCTLEKEDGK